VTGVQPSKLYWGPDRLQLLRNLRFDDGTEVTVPGFVFPFEGDFPSSESMTLTEAIYNGR